MAGWTDAKSRSTHIMTDEEEKKGWSLSLELFNVTHSKKYIYMANECVCSVIAFHYIHCIDVFILLI